MTQSELRRGSDEAGEQAAFVVGEVVVLALMVVRGQTGCECPGARAALRVERRVSAERASKQRVVAERPPEKVSVKELLFVLVLKREGRSCWGMDE
jgi:hypothetical protein